MRRTSPLLAAAALAAAALAPTAAAAPAAGPPGLASAPSCATQCIEAATVVARTGTAALRVETSVRTRVVVTVRRASGGGLASGAVFERASGPVRRIRHQLLLRNLRPGTRYAIHLRATSADGRSSTRAGTFTTREVQTIGLDAPGGLAAGTGCQTQCITGASVVPEHAGASFRIRTSVGADVRVDVARVAPTQTGGAVPVFNGGPEQSFAHHTQDRVLAFHMGDLAAGSRYHVVVRAQDANGYIAWRYGTFETRRRHVEVRFTHVEVIADGDAGGANRGELYVEGLVGSEHVFGNGCAKRKAGTWFELGENAWVRTNAPRHIELWTGAQEWDDAGVDRCSAMMIEHWSPFATDALSGMNGATTFGRLPLDLDAVLADMAPAGATSVLTGFAVGYASGPSDVRYRVVGELAISAR